MSYKNNKIVMFLLTTILLLPITAYAAKFTAATNKIVDSGKLTSQRQKLKDFSAINVQGPISVKIVSGTKNSDVRYIVDKEILPYIHTKIVHDELSIRVSKSHKLSTIVAIIRTRQLHKLKYEGSGNVTATGLSSMVMDVDLNTSGEVNLKGNIGLHHLNLHGSGMINITGVSGSDLTISSTGSDTVRLRGMADLKKISFEGSGHLNMFWVDSPTLKVRGKGKAVVQLGGRVGTLDLKLLDTAHFNGRYLRTKRAFVKTYQQSLAEIQVTGKQTTLASDQSNIYYYNRPDRVFTYMGQEGSVLYIKEPLYAANNMFMKG